MTAEKLHDAIGLLPADLVGETDALRRSVKPKASRSSWRRITAMAACFAVVLLAGMLVRGAMGGKKSASSEITMQNPAAAETFAAMEDNTVDAQEEAKEERSQGVAPADAGHTHAPAAGTEAATGDGIGYCGNTSATVYIDGEDHIIWGSDAIALTDILDNLSYDPDKLCSCPAEYAADTEMDTGYEISLTNYFVRHGGGQADLTETQAETIRQVIENCVAR